MQEKVPNKIFRNMMVNGFVLAVNIFMIGVAINNPSDLPLWRTYLVIITAFLSSLFIFMSYRYTIKLYGER